MLSRISARWWSIPVCLLAVAAILVANPNDEDHLSDHVDSMSAYSPPDEALAGSFARRMEIKNQIVEQLYREEITLKEATGHFLALNQEHEPIAEGVRCSFPGKTDEEKTAVNVIQYAACARGMRDEERRRVLNRLDGEFEQWFGHAQPCRY